MITHTQGHEVVWQAQRDLSTTAADKEELDVENENAEPLLDVSDATPTTSTQTQVTLNAQST